MKIFSTQPTIYKSVKQSHTPVSKQLNEEQNFVRFCGYQDFVKKSVKLGEAIESKEDYIELLEKVYSYKDSSGKLLFDAELNKHMYPKVKKEQEGLLLYAGCGDISDDINRYLSGRTMRNMTQAQARDVVKVLDYSLKELDKKYGRFSGVVYRQGVFPKSGGQFISTTNDPIIAATMRGGICMNKNLDFSVICAKNGHKINDFQRKMGSEYADEEEEILLSRFNKYKEIENPQGMYLRLKNNFQKTLETYAFTEINPDKVKVFVEI